MKVKAEINRQSLYAEVTGRVIAELEEGRLPWVQPWDNAACGCAMPANAASGRRYSGINVLILWAAVIEGGYSSQRWVTFRQAQAAMSAKARRARSSAMRTGSRPRASKSAHATRIAKQGRWRS